MPDHDQQPLNLSTYQQLTDLKLHMMSEETHEIKSMLTTLNEKIDKGFKSYDNKFWSLAMMTIATLLTAVGALVFYLLTHH